MTINKIGTINRGELVTVRGKLTVNNKGFSYQTIFLNINGEYRCSGTDKYGDYAYSFRAEQGKNTVQVYYYGDGYITDSKVQTSFTGKENNKVVTLKFVKNKLVEKFINGDQFISLYQTVNGQYDKGVYAEIPTIGLEYAPVNKIIKSKFYFKNSRGNVITRTVSASYMTYTETSLISGYTPYIVDITYCKMSEKDIQKYYEINYYY